MQQAPMDVRDHLFINYAVEDGLFARWLALRLTSEGHKVWIDQFKLLGGESYPRDIDLAIKTRTFRFLSLLSKHSIAKPNPLKERTLALNLAKQPGMTGFVVPLNVDGLRPTELDWLTSDLTFIPFSPSWEIGIRQLVKLLDRENCPKFEGDGRAIVSALASASDLVSTTPELLISNTSEFTQIPTHLTTYVVSPTMTGYNRVDASRDWAYYDISPHRVVAFHPPCDDLRTWLQAEEVRTQDWRDTPDIEGVRSENIVTALLRRCIEVRCRSRGFIWFRDPDAFCCQLPFGTNLSVRLPSGKRTTAQSSGQRTYFRVGYPKVQYRYWLAVSPTIVRNLMDEYSLVWRLRLHFTDTNNVPIPPAQRQSRRKHLTRNWRNWHWLVRHLGVVQHLASSDDSIRAGLDGPQQVILDCETLCFTASKGIDEEKLEAPEEISDDIPVEEEFESDGDGNADDE